MSAIFGEHSHGEYQRDDNHDQPEYVPESHADSATPEQLACSATRPILARHHHSKLASSLGWICWEELIFDARATHLWLRELAKLRAVRRAKAVLRTNEGWWAFNLVDGSEEMWPSGHRRDSRIELVVQGESPPNPETIEEHLRACLVIEGKDPQADPQSVTTGSSASTRD